MRRTITITLLATYKDSTFNLSRRRVMTLGFNERMAIEKMRIKVHPHTWSTYTECLTRWQSAGMPRRMENAKQRRERSRFYKSLTW